MCTLADDHGTCKYPTCRLFLRALPNGIECCLIVVQCLKQKAFEASDVTFNRSFSNAGLAPAPPSPSHQSEL